jgi:hypothetical protein
VASSEFDLKKLTKFNPALVYGFERESSVLEERVDQKNIESYIFGSSQLQDMLDAYLYAQDVIIPEIEKLGRDKITPDMVLQWLDQIHLRIARTLAQDQTDAHIPGALAGVVCPRQITRWHKGREIMDCCKMFLSGKEPAGSSFAASLEKNGVPFPVARKFVEVLEKVKRDKTLEIPDYEKKHLDAKSPFVVGQVILNKLFVAYHTKKKLTEKERECVSKVVKICSPPEKFPELRQRFAKEFLDRWKKVNSKDINDVSNFMFFIFYQITEGHWWFNGNGRTTTCFLNTILVALGHPSILVRNPEEKHALKGSYCLGIELIDSQPQIMQDHLTKRLVETRNGNFYHDKTKERLMVGYVKLGKLLALVKSQFPDYDLKSFFKGLMVLLSQEVTVSGITEREKIDTFLTDGYVKYVAGLLNHLRQAEKESFITRLSTPAAAQTASRSDNDQKPNMGPKLGP